MHTAKERELQKISQALTTISKRVNGLSLREGNKVDGGDNKSGGGGNNSGIGVGGGNHNISRKMATKKTTPTVETKSGYTQKAWNTIPHGPIRRGNGSTKSKTWLTKNLERKIQRSGRRTNGHS